MDITVQKCVCGKDAMLMRALCSDCESEKEFKRIKTLFEVLEKPKKRMAIKIFIFKSIIFCALCGLISHYFNIITSFIFMLGYIFEDIFSIFD